MNKKTRVLLAVPVLFLVAVLAIAAFDLRSDQLSGESDAGSASDTRAEPGQREPGPAEPGQGNSLIAPDGAKASDTTSTRAAAIEPMTRAVISTGQVTVRPESVTRARAEVMRLVASWGGTVADEQSSSNARGRMVDSTLTLRVPTAKFDEAMNSFAGLGKVEQQSRKSEDVTTKVVDNDARVRAAERSIRQIEALLGRAQELGDVIAIESELARRQADLDSLKSQQAYLSDQTSLSTINVFLSRSGHGGPAEPEARGFLAGLDSGWTAMKGAAVVLLTVLGAVLPFVLVLVLLGVPLWLVVRRRTARAALSGGSAPARSA